MMSLRWSHAAAWSAAVVVTLGVIAWVGAEEGTPPARSEARGAFWSAELSNGDPLVIAPPTPGVIVPDGAVVTLAFPDTVSGGVKSVGLEWTALASTSALELTLRGNEAGASVVRVIPGAPAVVLAGRRSALGHEKVLARSTLANGPGAQASSRVRVTLDEERFLLAVDGHEALSWSDPAATGTAITVEAQGGGVQLTHLRATTFGVDGPQTWRDDLNSFEPESPWTTRLVRTRHALTFLATVVLWLALIFALVRQRLPAFPELLTATAFGLALPALPSALGLFGVAVRMSPFTLGVLGLLGTAAACTTLFTRDQDDAPSAHPVRLLLLRLAAVVVALIVASVTASEERARELAPQLAAEDAAWNAPTPPDFTLRASKFLSAGNALHAPGAWRDFTLRAEVTLGRDAVCEWRVRASGDKAWSLCLSTRDDVPTRWIEQDTLRVIPVDGGIRVTEPIDLEIEARGRELIARINGRELVVDAAVGGAGSVIALGVSGRVRVESCSVVGATAVDEPDARWASSEQQRAAAFLVFVFFSWVFLATLVTRAPGWAIAAPAAGALAPLLFACQVADPLPGHAFLALTSLAVATAIILAATGVFAARGRLVASGVLALASLVCAPAIVFSTARMHRAAGLTPPAYSALLESRGERSAQGLAHWQTPILRHLNEALADHRFRGQHVDVAPKHDTFRVLALGGSVTYGYHIPQQDDAAFPAVLEREVDGVRVINAAWRGSTSSRLLRMFRDGFARISLDAVVLCVTYNDAFALSRVDEHAMLASFENTTRDEPSWMSRVATFAQGVRSSIDYLGGDRDLGRLLYAASAEPSRTTTQLWEDLGLQSGRPAPPERFKNAINQFIELTRERNIALILVAEPLADDGPVIWKDEFRAVLREAARAEHVDLVDPTPALQRAGGAALFLDRVHPNIEGHAVIAREIAPVLRALRN